MDWNKNLRATILKWATAHPSDHSCEVVQNGVMQELGFDLKPFLKNCKGNRSGIQPKINALNELALGDSLNVTALTGEQAQATANASTGDVIVLALMSEKLSTGVQKNHVAIVIDGLYTKTNGPNIGGGGMLASQIEKGWALSNARIHFTDMQKVKYFSYEYRG